MYCLILNFLLYFITFIYICKHEKGLTINSCIFLFISFVALCGIFVYDSEFYIWGDYNIYGGFTRNQMSLPPLLFLYLGFILYFLSIKNINSNKVVAIVPLKSWVVNLIYYVNIIIFIIIIIAFQESASAASIDFGEAYDDRNILASSKLGSLGIYALTISAGLSTSQVLLPIYLLLRKNRRNYMKSILFILLFFYTSYVKGSLIASRGILFFSLINIIFVFFFFYRMLDVKIRKIVISIFVVILILFAVLSVIISIGRFGDAFLQLIIGYFGEPFINFPLIYWNYPEFLEGRYLLSSMGLTTLNMSSLKVSLIYFRTMPGTFYVDFGPIGALLFIAIYALFFKVVIGKKNVVMTMDRLLIYFYVVFGFIYGVFGFSVYGWSGYLILMINYYLFKIGTLKKYNIN